MLRTPRLLTLLSLCVLAPAAFAQAQQKPSEAPPKLQVVDEGADAPLKVERPRQGGTKIVEKKVGGKVTEVTVKAGPSTYTMKPHDPPGNAQPGDGQSPDIRAPQWTIFEFDLFGKKKGGDKDAAPADADAAAAPAPPPPKVVK